MLENPISVNAPVKQPRKSRAVSSVTLNVEMAEPDLLKPRIVIFGVGGAGGNAVNNMIRSKLEGVEFVAANTDAQALTSSLAQSKIQLGLKVTKGLGAGSFPDRGRAAAEENIDDISRFLDGSNMVFIAAGMGGGTGTGGAPVIAKLARERDILTVGVVTKPFHFEGKYRMEIAEAGIEELKKHVDTLIIIPNQNLFRIANERTTFESAFKMADDVLQAGVRGVTDLITMPGLVNLDFADIRTIMTKMGKAMMGTGEAEGENRAITACEAAVSNPLLDDISIKGAKGVLVNMTGGPDMTLFEADMAVNAIRKEVDPSANIIFGSAFNENMKGKIRISVVATGIDAEELRRDANKAAAAVSSEPSRFRAGNGASAKSFFDPGVVAKPANEEIVVNNTEPESVEEEVQTQIFTEEEFQNVVEEVVAPVIENKQATKQRAKSKKESSGFSLFSFMNSNKLEEPVESGKIEPVETVEPVVAKEEAEKKRRQFFGGTIFDEEEEKQEAKFDDDILNVPAFFRRKK
ncbi:MAG: cell division protein FtsZ [Alphaproteobacteria bacterium]|nr:cell division protein FtsZ [Alphaproteobacteria bacterium]